jgi:uncharacterized protein (TIGR02246 family)
MTMTNPEAISAPVREAALAGVLESWATNIELHRPDAVAAAFTEDAVFQGSAPSYSVGRAGVASYYDARPPDLHAVYRVRETRAIGQDAFTAFVDVDFRRPDGQVDRTHLTLVLVRSDGWLIKQYHVSKVNTVGAA